MLLKGISVALALAVWFSCFGTGNGYPSGEDEDPAMSAEEFQKWLNEEVIDLLTDEECFIAWQVKTADQRRIFVREFWAARNPNPEYGESFFRRNYECWRAYANENFASTKRPGAQTDRGRIFVLLGPPDWVKLFWPLRVRAFGSCCYGSFPYEVWRYDKVSIRGRVFENLELEFVDPALNGEFRLPLPPEEKKLFLREPCMELPSGK